MSRWHGSGSGIAALCPISLACLLLICLLPTPVSAAVPGRIGVNGTSLTVGGANITSTMIGVDECTVFVYAVDAYCEGHTQNWGMNMNFPFATSTEYARLDCNDLTSLWHQYFWLCAHYGLKQVRIQNGDTWSSQIIYEAWLNHRTLFFDVVDEMLKEANQHGVYVCFNLAGIQNIPAYNYGGTGSIFAHSHAAGSAYDNYFHYVRSVIAHCDASSNTNAIFSYDTFNEPDHDQIYATVWNSNKSAFHSWACAVANDTTPLTTHIVEMGVGGHGSFFGFNQADFDLATGQVGFDICHYHSYFSSEYVPSISWPKAWASAVNKPLNFGEIAKNTVAPPWTYEVWPWFETTAKAYNVSAFEWMYLTGTSGYPFVGTIPADSSYDGTHVYPKPQGPPLTADFSSSVSGAAVAFTDATSTTHSLTRWTWDFGDGGTSLLQNPTHTYALTGSYQVKLTVQDDMRRTDSITRTVSVTVPGGGGGGGGPGGGGSDGSGSVIPQGIKVDGAWGLVGALLIGSVVVAPKPAKGLRIIAGVVMVSAYLYSIGALQI
jgi:PKD repeat protein